MYVGRSFAIFKSKNKAGGHGEPSFGNKICITVGLCLILIIADHLLVMLLL